MIRPSKTLPRGSIIPDNRFVNCSSEFHLMAETSPHVLERWATLHLPAQDESVRDELRRSLDTQSVRQAA
jgi:hypothetical protein